MRCHRGAVFGIESAGNYRLTVILRVGQGRPDSTFLSVKARFCADFELVVDRTTNPSPATILTLVVRQGGFFNAFFSKFQPGKAELQHGSVWESGSTEIRRLPTGIAYSVPFRTRV